jgi:transcription elongation factor Elf1
MEISACPRCGSRKIFQGTIGDGVLTGYTNRQVCRNCGFQGMPIIFNTEQDYVAFLESIGEKQKTTSKEKQQLKETSKDSYNRPAGLYLLSAFLVSETIIAFFIFTNYPTLIQFTNVPGVLYLTMFMLTGIILPIGFLLGSSWSYTVGGILFIFTIPINLPCLYYITRPHVKSFLLKKEKTNNQRN